MWILISGHSRRCVRSVLLDPLHVHNTTCPIATRGAGRGTPWCHDQRTRPGGREEICDLLSVGRVHPFLSGNKYKWCQYNSFYIKTRLLKCSLFEVESFVTVAVCGFISWNYLKPICDCCHPNNSCTEFTQVYI